MTYEVGQTVFIAADRRGFGSAAPGRTAVITKIGSKWAYLDDPKYGRQERFNVATGWLDAHGYTPTSRAWESNEEYERAVAAQRAWDEFKRDIAYATLPPGVTAEDIQLIRKILRKES